MQPLNCAEVFGVCICFVDNDNKITFRAIELKFYSESFNRHMIIFETMKILIGQGIDYSNIKFFIADGCNTNLAALRGLCQNLPQVGEVICLSHSSKNIGKVLSSSGMLSKAFQFELLWSQMISHSERAKSLFKQLANLSTSPKTTNQQRWYYFYEIVKEIYDNSAAVREVIQYDDDFAEETRKGLRAMIKYEEDENGNVLVNEVAEVRWQLAAIIDIGKHLVQFCYSSEVDGQLRCAKVFDHWQRLETFLSRASRLKSTDTQEIANLLPSVHANALSLSGDDASSDEYKKIIESAVAAVRPVYQKFVDYDSHGRERTIRIMRACRFFNYNYIRRSSQDDLKEEVQHLKTIAYFNDSSVFDKLQRGLRQYRETAIAYANSKQDDEDDNLWDFWTTNKDLLPDYFSAACEVAIIPPSSATVERLFSYLTSAFGSSQEHLLADIKKASTLIRYNENMRGNFYKYASKTSRKKNV